MFFCFCHILPRLTYHFLFIILLLLVSFIVFVVILKELSLFGFLNFKGNLMECPQTVVRCFKLRRFSFHFKCFMLLDNRYVMKICITVEIAILYR